MNWSRTKTWLIVLFACLNVFLIYTIVSENRAASTISDSTVQNTVSILSKNGITVSADTIPTKMPSLCAVSVENTFSSADDAAKRLLGEDYRITPIGYVCGNKTLTVKGDELSYNDNAPENALPLSEATAPKNALDILSSLGFDVRNAKTKITYNSENIIDVAVSQHLDSYPLLDSKLIVTLSSKGFTELHGCWFYLSEDQSQSGGSSMIKDSTSMLVDFMAHHQGENIEISNISLGYMTGDRQNFHKTATASPMWQITSASGAVYYEDAN